MFITTVCVLFWSNYDGPRTKVSVWANFVGSQELNSLCTCHPTIGKNYNIKFNNNCQVRPLNDRCFCFGFDVFLFWHYRDKAFDVADANPPAELYLQNLKYSNVGGSSHTDSYLTVFAYLYLISQNFLFRFVLITVVNQVSVYQNSFI